MFARNRLENILAIVCALARLAVCCYRAVTQAIVVDEATTYNKYISGTWRKLFGRYDANNHTLSSIFIKASVAVGGLSEFTLRLPSLIAGFFLVLGVFWLLKRIESWPLRWGAFAVVCTCPMLLDFSIMARGYSLSLAFFVWALYFSMEHRYLLAGCLLGLSIASNLTILFPVLALFVAVALFDRRIKSLISLVIPALLLAALITGPSLRRAHRDDFYIGYAEFRHAVISFVATTLYATDRIGILGVRGVAVLNFVNFGLPLFFLLVAGACIRSKSRRQFIPFFALVIAFAGIVLAHWWFGLNYPADRTCLYFIILAAVSWAIAGDAFKSRAVQLIWLAPLIVLVIQFSTQLQTRFFEFWNVEADDKQMAMLIQQATSGKPDNSVTLGANWMHQPSLEFYRRYLRITALRPVERFDPLPLTGFDFYLLGRGDVDRAKDAGLRAIFADDDLQVMLATPSSKTP